MENQVLDDHYSGYTPQTRIPKDNSILTTGIIALPFSFGIVGIILSIITLVNASSAMRIYNANPKLYLDPSIKKVKAGKICAIVSLSIFGTAMLLVLLLLVLN